MSNELATTTIKDDFGGEHQYTHDYWGPDEGVEILLRLTSMLGGAMGRAWGSLSMAVLPEKIEELDQMLASQVDGDGLANMVDKLVVQIMDQGGSAFMIKLLDGTARDGVKLNRLGFNQAFKRNYGELIMALKWVVTENVGPLFVRVMGGGAVIESLTKLADTFKGLSEDLKTETVPAEPSAPLNEQG